MANKPTTTSRKSRFEMLEDRRLLTTWNVDAKFTTGADGGEAAFGDNATETAGQLHSTYNNNYGSGAVTVTDAATMLAPGHLAVWTAARSISAITSPIRSAPTMTRIRSTITSRAQPTPLGRPDFPAEPWMESMKGTTASRGFSAGPAE